MAGIGKPYIGTPGGLSSLFDGSKPNKETSNEMSKLASDILSGRKTPTVEDAKKLAASVLSQDETRGQRR